MPCKKSLDLYPFPVFSATPTCIYDALSLSCSLVSSTKWSWHAVGPSRHKINCSVFLLIPIQMAQTTLACVLPLGKNMPPITISHNMRCCRLPRFDMDFKVLSGAVSFHSCCRDRTVLWGFRCKKNT